MDELTMRLAAVMADACRAAHPGAIGTVPDGEGALNLSPVVVGEARFAPSASPLSVAIDGAGLFAFDDRGHRVYGRLGDFRIDARGTLVDGSGRTVLATSATIAQPSQEGLAPIRIADATARADVSIDERGEVSCTIAGRRQTLGRLALAFPDAPSRMRRVDETTVASNGREGAIHFAFPGVGGAGVLKARMLESGLVDLQGDLAEMWRLRRRGELAEARAAAADDCVRASLGLVK